MCFEPPVPTAHKSGLRASHSVLNMELLKLSILTNSVETTRIFQLDKAGARLYCLLAGPENSTLITPSFHFQRTRPGS